jgi:GTPase SAR1 family protein
LGADDSMPSLYIIAGPNGAGKTTFVRDFLRFDFTENRPLKLAQGDPRNHLVFTPSIFQKLVSEFNLML